MLRGRAILPTETIAGLSVRVGGVGRLRSMDNELDTLAATRADLLAILEREANRPVPDLALIKLITAALDTLWGRALEILGQ